MASLTHARGSVNARREPVPDLGRTIGGVEQEGRAGERLFEDVVALQEVKLVARDEVRPLDQVGRADRLMT